MERIFRASKMLTRLENEGRMNEVTADDMALIKFLDGKHGNDYNWASFVKGEPLVWIEGGDTFDGKPFEGTYVNEVDCD